MRYVKQFFRVLIFFPSITFNLLTAEVFPWAFFYSIFQKKDYKRGLPLLLILVTSAVLATAYAFSMGIVSDSFRSLMAYLNPILLFLFLLRCSSEEIESFNNIVGKILLFYLLLGIFQFFGLISFLEPVFKFLLTRGSTDVFAFGRGVSLLSSEPSRAAYELIFVYILWVYLKGNRLKNQFIFDILMFFFLALIVRSSLGLFTFFVYLFFKYKMFFILSTILVLLFALPFIEYSESRAMAMLYDILTFSDSSDLFSMLTNQSGFRVISILASYKYALLYPFGGGVGLWVHSSVSALKATGFDPSSMYYFQMYGGGDFSSVRPDSFMASAALDIGLVGVLLVLYMIKPILKLLKEKKDAVFLVVVVFIFIIFFTGAVGNPIPWLCVALAYRKYKENIDKQELKISTDNKLLEKE